jgi:hypothetical protein
MAMQRITVATIAGEAGVTVSQLFHHWRVAQTIGSQGDVARCVDLFADQLRANGGFPPILYFSEWFDLWLMGDSIHSTKTISGKRYEVRCAPRDEALKWADQCGKQFSEQQWLAARLREAAEAWRELAESATVVFLREVLDSTVTDEEVKASLCGQPEWLSLCQTDGRTL